MYGGTLKKMNPYPMKSVVQQFHLAWSKLSTTSEVSGPDPYCNKHLQY